MPCLDVCRTDMELAVETCARVWREGGKLLLCGNGGSHADAQHIEGELMKSFLVRRAVSRPDLGEDCERLPAGLEGALPALALAASGPLASAICNDSSDELVFAQQVFGLGRPGDLLVAISTSGRARNVLLAVQTARALGIRTLALSGQPGTPLADVCDGAILVPASATTEVQELHLPVYHAICAELEQMFFGTPAERPR